MGLDCQAAELTVFVCAIMTHLHQRHLTKRLLKVKYFIQQLNNTFEKTELQNRVHTYSCLMLCCKPQNINLLPEVEELTHLLLWRWGGMSTLETLSKLA